MRRALESTLERRIVRYCNEHCVWQQKLIGRKGMPDRVLYMPNGKSIFIEFKRPKEKLSYMQKICHRGLKLLGYEVHICTSYAQTVDLIQPYLEGGHERPTNTA